MVTIFFGWLPSWAVRAGAVQRANYASASVGGGLGAGLGALIGGASGHAGRGALIGGAAGAGIGALAGNSQDQADKRQEKREEQRIKAIQAAQRPPLTTVDVINMAHSHV